MLCGLHVGLAVYHRVTSDLSIQCPEGYVGDGVLCAVDSDRDGYTDIDISALYNCHSDTPNQLCQQVRYKALICSPSGKSGFIASITHHRTFVHICTTPSNHQMY